MRSAAFSHTTFPFDETYKDIELGTLVSVPQNMHVYCMHVPLKKCKPKNSL